MDVAPHVTRGWLQDVAYGNGRFVALGINGAILVSQPVLSIKPGPRIADGTTPFRIGGIAGLSCKIQVSSDLINWQDLSRLVLANETEPFLDHSTTNFSQRFYRVVSP